MKLTVGIVISVLLWISIADAIGDFMPLDVPKLQLKKTNAKATKKHEILPPIENGDTMTHADSSIEGLSNEEGDGGVEKATSRGSITSPRQKSKAIEEQENTDINDDNKSGTLSSNEEEMDQEATKFNTEAHEEPAIVNNDEEEGGRENDDGVKDEADNIEEVDVNDGDEQVNTGDVRNQDEWGKEVHEDD